MPNNQVKADQRPIYQKLLDMMHQLSSKQKSTLERLWVKLNANPNIGNNDIVAALIDHSKAYFPVASHLAVTAYNELSPTDFFAQAPSFPDNKTIGKAFGRALVIGNPDKTSERLNGVSQRFLWNVSRETFTHNANREGVGWKRAADANACPFCKLLVLNTAKVVYHEADINTHYHDNCHCFVVRANDYTNHPDFEAWQQQYNDAVAQGGTTKLKPLMAAWRQVDNSA